MAERFDVIVVGLGALGSGTCWQLARRGVRVLGVEQFELGHERGASHDTSRILRRSYHTARYVTLAGEAYDDWAALSADAADELVTVVGGLDLFPPDAAIPIGGYTSSMTAAGVPYSVLGAAEVASRWPRVRLPTGTVALYQADTAIVPAARGTAAMQRAARTHGAVLRDRTPVVGIRPNAGRRGGVEVATADGHRHRADRVVVTADGWTNELLAGLGTTLPLTVTQEQVTRFAADDPRAFAADRFPVWIWMDDPSFYGFPADGEALVKAAQDCGGPPVTVWDRSFDPDPARVDLLASFVRTTFPGLRRAVRSKTCLYTLTPDRDFVLDALPSHPDIFIGLGAGHGFKFAPSFGRILADLATTGTTSSDIGAFAIDRPALTEPAREPSWLV
jgi:monomeric sarcosine oxidase